MIYLLLVYVFISLICFCAGLSFYAIFPFPGSDAGNVYKKPLASYLVTGLIVITCLGQWMALFLPLSFFALPIIILLLAILFILYRKKITTRFCIKHIYLTAKTASLSFSVSAFSCL